MAKNINSYQLKKLVFYRQAFKKEVKVFINKKIHYYALQKKENIQQA